MAYMKVSASCHLFLTGIKFFSEAVIPSNVTLTLCHSYHVNALTAKINDFEMYW